MKKGTIHSIETKQKMRLAHTGNKHTKEAKRKISEVRKGCKHSKKTKDKIGNANKGKKSYIMTEEIKRKMSKNSAKFWKGKKFSEITRKKLSEAKKGEKNWNWKGGINPENIKIRNGIEVRLWREAVFARDNWTCQKYGVRGGKLNAHHIQNFAQYPELRFAIDNGITLSEKAHGEFHKKYGRENNTKEQLKEFLLG